MENRIIDNEAHWFCSEFSFFAVVNTEAPPPDRDLRARS